MVPAIVYNTQNYVDVVNIQVLLLFFLYLANLQSAHKCYE
jgi:hypothetical protein